MMGAIGSVDSSMITYIFHIFMFVHVQWNARNGPIPTFDSTWRIDKTVTLDYTAISTITHKERGLPLR